uniref:Reverse transcriptase domain-containing protein n=1 Tax=Solanum lycopersicum TaxID=4081 RepID=A0A3Q7GF93_SOLLC
MSLMNGVFKPFLDSFMIVFIDDILVKRAPRRAYASFRRFSCAIAHHFLGDRDSDVKNAKFFCGRPSRPSVCIRLVITAFPTHLEGQTSPEASIRLISMIFVPYLCIRLAITACPTHLEGQTSPEASIRLISTIFTIFWVIGIPTSKMPNFFVDIRKDLVYAYDWPSRLVRPIWKVKRVPKRAYASFRRFSCAIANHFLDLVYAYSWPSRLVRPIWKDSDVKNAKFFRGCPSRLCLCIRLAITACPTHLEGQTSPKASIRLISTIFTIFWVIGIPTSKMPNFFVDVRQDLVYAYSWPSRLVRPIWKVKRAPKQAYAPCLCIRLVITAFPTHLEGQTSPEASIRLISTIFTIFWVIGIPTSKMPYFFVHVRQDLVNAYGWPSQLVRPNWKVKRASKRAYASFRRFSPFFG